MVFFHTLGNFHLQCTTGNILLHLDSRFLRFSFIFLQWAIFILPGVFHPPSVPHSSGNFCSLGVFHHQVFSTTRCFLVVISLPGGFFTRYVFPPDFLLLPVGFHSGGLSHLPGFHNSQCFKWVSFSP